jgi:hypothetical protein
VRLARAERRRCRRPAQPALLLRHVAFLGRSALPATCLRTTCLRAVALSAEAPAAQEEPSPAFAAHQCPDRYAHGSPRGPEGNWTPTTGCATTTSSCTALVNDTGGLGVSAPSPQPLSLTPGLSAHVDLGHFPTGLLDHRRYPSEPPAEPSLAPTTSAASEARRAPSGAPRTAAPSGARPRRRLRGADRSWRAEAGQFTRTSNAAAGARSPAPGGTSSRRSHRAPLHTRQPKRQALLDPDWHRRKPILVRHSRGTGDSLLPLVFESA